MNNKLKNKKLLFKFPKSNPVAANKKAAVDMKVIDGTALTESQKIEITIKVLDRIIKLLYIKK